METLTIEINNPKARRLIDDLVDLGLISVKEERRSWSERWEELFKTLPDTDSITEEEIFEEIRAVRENRESN
jgi:transcription initiation factor IIE alpha subunit